MPHFELVWVNCSRNESFRGLWRCSVHSEEESFELGQHRDEQPVSCPMSLEMVINSTVSVVKKREDVCCEQLKLLRPAHTRTLLPICHGKLVRRCFLLCCPYTVLYGDKFLIIVCICPSARSDSVRGEEAVYSPGASKTHRPSEGAYCGFTFWCTSLAVDPHITSEDTS